MTKILGLAAILALCALPGEAHGQSPDDVQAAIATQGGAYAPCLLQIVAREDPNLDPMAVNPSSGAFGLFQFLQHGGEWDVVGEGEPVAVASVSEQILAAVKALLRGDGPMAWGVGCGT